MARSLLEDRTFSSSNSTTKKNKEKPFTASNKAKTKKSLFNKKEKPITDSNPVINDTFSAIDEKLEAEKLIKEDKERNNKKTAALKELIVKLAVILGCVYLIFLIYGAIITEYTYDEAGNSVPLEMNISALKDLDDFQALINKYLEMRCLYEQTLDLDYEFYKDETNKVSISAKYEGLLEDVAKLSIQTDAVTVPTKYSQMKSMMLKWIKDDIAVYLQNMSAAISENNTEKANNAAEYRKITQNDFTIITNNLISIGYEVKGFDTTDLSNWTVDKYTAELSAEKVDDETETN